MSRSMRAIGLMSGTSLDGIDAAIVETDGEFAVSVGEALSMPYAPAQRTLFRRALTEAANWLPGAPMPDLLVEAEEVLTRAHIDAVHRLLDRAGTTAGSIEIIGFHGQTVLHDPARRRSVQVGRGDLLAQETGIAVINDFRAADIQAGGQGAPLAPLYHAARARALTADGPIAVLNLGGVGNVTWIAGDGELLAFDTGPGNALLDDWAERHTGDPIDRHGALARAGVVHGPILERLLDNTYFDRPPPKSLDRLHFSMGPVEELSAADGAATLTAFTAATVSLSVRHMPRPPVKWIVCGGGRRNPALMAELGARLQAPVVTAEDVGWRGDDLEAEAFAYLAVRSFHGLPLSLPSTTGVPVPQTGGRLHRPD